jgi:hypothetical protein
MPPSHASALHPAAEPLRSEGVRYPDRDAPYYVSVGREVEIFEACHARGLPVMLKGPTG